MEEQQGIWRLMEVVRNYLGSKQVNVIEKMIEWGWGGYLFVTGNYRTENPNTIQLRITFTVFPLISTGYLHILIFSKRKLLSTAGTAPC